MHIRSRSAAESLLANSIESSFLGDLTSLDARRMRRQKFNSTLGMRYASRRILALSFV